MLVFSSYCLVPSSQWLSLNIFALCFLFVCLFVCVVLFFFAQETIVHHAKWAPPDSELLKNGWAFHFSFISNNHHYHLIPIEMSLKINILPDFSMNCNYISKWKITFSFWNIIAFAECEWMIKIQLFLKARERLFILACSGTFFFHLTIFRDFSVPNHLSLTQT